MAGCSVVITNLSKRLQKKYKQKQRSIDVTVHKVTTMVLTQYKKTIAINLRGI